MEEYITKKEACDILKVSQQTIERYMRMKKIPYFKSGASITCKVLFKKSDIDEYLEKNYKGE